MHRTLYFTVLSDIPMSMICMVTAVMLTFIRASEYL